MIHRTVGAVLALASIPLAAPAVAQPAKAVVQQIKVHGVSLEGNLEGNSADRDVLVVLPPSYATAKNRRYPALARSAVGSRVPGTRCVSALLAMARSGSRGPHALRTNGAIPRLASVPRWCQSVWAVCLET